MRLGRKLRAMKRSSLRMAAGAAALALVGLAVFFAATQLLGSEDSLVTQTQGSEDPVKRAMDAFERDNAKPAFQGQLGDFFVVQEPTTTERPCPGPYESVYDIDVIRESELYSEVFGQQPQMGVCPDGSPVGIMFWGDDVISRSYFFGTPQYTLTAPRERLRLLTVAGRPALAEVPIANALVSSAQLIVIERYPDGDTPGIELGIVTVNDLDRAIALAEQILGASR